MDKNLRNAFQMVVENYNRKEEVAEMSEGVKDGLQAEELPFIEQYCKVKPKATILDVGCGAGREAFALHKMGFNVAGIDVAGNMIREAKRNARNSGTKIDFKIGDGIQLPFESHSFDYVLMLNRVLEHIPKKESRIKALQEVRRVLKPRGIAIINAMNSSLLSEYFFTLYSFVMPFCERERWQHELKETEKSALRYYFGRYVKGIVWNSLVVPVNSLKNLKRRILMAVLKEQYNSLEPGDTFYERKGQGNSGTIFFHRHTIKEVLDAIARSELMLKEYKSRFELTGNPFGKKFLRKLEIMHYYTVQKPML